MAEETTPKTNPPEAKAKAAKAKAAGKSAKKPKLEDKPFTEFMEQHFMPALQEALNQQGISDLELSFKQANLPSTITSSPETCWQAIGIWQGGQRQFNLYFLEDSITGKKAFSASTNGKPPSTLESFMIDERRITLDLLVLYTLQRLNGQKWLTRN